MGISRVVRMRGGALLGAFAIVATTATIAATAGQLMAAGLGAPGPGRFAAADLVVRADPKVRLGDDTLDARRPALLAPSAVRRVGAIPGVRSALGDVAFPVAVIGRGGAPVPSRGGLPAQAHGWPSAALTPYRLISGHVPTAPGALVLDAGLARAGRLHLGDPVRVVTPAGSHLFRLTGVAGAAARQLRARSAVFFAPGRAQQLSGLGAGVNAIAVRAAPGADRARLRALIADGVGRRAQVLDHRHASAADAGDPAAFDRIALVAVLASGGGITLAIAIFVVAGTIAFAIAGRRREIAVLRAIGATPGRVRAMLMREVAVVGLVAGAAGCVAARALLGASVGALESVSLAPQGFTVTPGWIPYAIAIGAGAGVALAATLVAAHPALAVRPGEALVDAALPPRRLGIMRALLGFLALGGGVALVIVLHAQALSFATLAASCFMIAVALLGPLLIGRPVALAGRSLLAAGGAGFLAGSSLATGRFRVGAGGAAIALVVALAGTQVLSSATAQRATERTTAHRVRAAHVIVARAGGGLPPSVARTAARLPSARVTPMVSTDLSLPDPGLLHEGDGWTAAGLPPGTSPDTLRLGVRGGSLDSLRGDAIAVSDTIARAGQVTIGSILDARLADATAARLRVVAIYRRANGIGDVILPRALALAHATAALDSAVFVAGTNTRALHAVVRSVPSAAVDTRAQYLNAVLAQGRQDADSQWVIDALMILVAVMAAFNTGAMAAAERRRELTLARLCGATGAQLMRALTLESLLTTLAGIAVGTLIVVVSLSRADSDPAGGPLSLPAGQAALVLAGAAALGLGGQLLPAALIHRADGGADR